MRPFFFGRSERPLFGCYHPPATRSARPGAVLLCGPFGQEAIRAHRMFAVLASKLTKAGLHVMRFDYYGTGDSAGAVEDANHAQWLEDVLEAHEELTASSGVSRVTWVGLRYGATLAVLASHKLSRPIAGLVAWDPIIDGAAYLSELEAAHAAFMNAELAQWRPSSPSGSEALGFPISSELRTAMAGVDLAAASRPKARQLGVIVTGDSTGLQRFREVCQPWGDKAKWLEMTTVSPWNSDDNMNSSLVPIDVLDAIIARVQESP